ncbi:MAG: hypothetical protein H0X55_02415 [Thermoleophilaceae bacterium]|nr:hypothetical protein [Thermoleophilaceae bacterium]
MPPRTLVTSVGSRHGSDPAGRVKGLGLSERRACRITAQHRSTQRHERAPASEDAALRTRLRELSRERPRWGYRRATRGSAEMNGRGRPGTLYGGSKVPGQPNGLAPPAGRGGG